jgi:radical SAM superfamily enzyme YgiQ (UPF0313 family)
VGNVIGEIRDVIDQYGCNFVEFEDDNLTLNRERAIELFDQLKSLGIKWSAPNGLMIGKLDEEILKKMKASGFESFFLPIESGDPDILKLMNKKIDLEHAANIARICVSLKLKVAAAIIIGHPGETRDSFMKTMAYCERLHKIGIRDFAFLMLNTYPGTKVFKDYADANAVSSLTNSDFLGHEEVTLETQDFDTKELNWRMAYANRKFIPKAVSIYHRHRLLFKKILGEKMIQTIKSAVSYR